jgi:hypothetical protein
VESLLGRTPAKADENAFGGVEDATTVHFTRHTTNPLPMWMIREPDPQRIPMP